MSNKDQYFHLKMRQARRAERPYSLIKGIMLFGMAVTGLAVIHGCGCGVDTDKPTVAQATKDAQSLFVGDAQAHKVKMPSIPVVKP